MVDALQGRLAIEGENIAQAALASSPVRIPAHGTARAEMVAHTGMDAVLRAVAAAMRRGATIVAPGARPTLRYAVEGSATLERRLSAAVFAHRRTRAKTPMTTLRFTKMQGLGNDFVVLDATRSAVRAAAGADPALADRRFGVGCDQVLVVEPARGRGADFRYRIFNADGGEVEQCGNGARCFVVFVREHGLTDQREIRVETAGGVIVPKLEDDGEVTVDMGVPRFEPAAIPFIGGTGAVVEPLDVDGTVVEISAVSMGNPHAVQVVDDVDAAPVATQGPRIERHPRFPQRVNAGLHAGRRSRYHSPARLRTRRGRDARVRHRRLRSGRCRPASRIAR